MIQKIKDNHESIFDYDEGEKTETYVRRKRARSMEIWIQFREGNHTPEELAEIVKKLFILSLDFDSEDYQTLSKFLGSEDFDESTCEKNVKEGLLPKLLNKLYSEAERLNIEVPDSFSFGDTLDGEFFRLLFAEYGKLQSMMIKEIKFSNDLYEAVYGPPF